MKLLLILMIITAVSGCSTISAMKKWPEEMPAKSIFVEAYNEQKAAGSNNNSLQNHLLWVKRYYLGSVIYPLGWNRMTEMLTDTLENINEKEEIRRRMYTLGVTICLEWAKNNDVRKIDSAAIATWGNALQTATELREQSVFISKVENDVQALLDGDLDRKQIERERYYPPEDYDNF